MKSLVLVASLALMAAACSPTPTPDTPAAIGMANPASVNCVREGARLDIRTNKDGAQYGVCVFNDGRQCEEWALLRDKRCVAPS